MLTNTHCLSIGIVKLYYKTLEGSRSGNVNEQTAGLASPTDSFLLNLQLQLLRCKSVLMAVSGIS